MKPFFRALGKSTLCLVVFLTQQYTVTSVISALTMLQSQDTSQESLYTAVMSQASLISAISGLLTLISLFLLFFVLNKNPLHECGLNRCRLKPLLLSIPLGIGSCMITMLLLLTVPFPEEWMVSYAESAETIAGGFGFWDILSTILLAPLVEEIVFRGLIYRTLKTAIPSLLAALLTSAVFGVLHGTAVWFCYTFLFSLVLIWLYECTQSLWPCVLCHATFNTFGQLPIFTENTSEIAMILILAGGVAVFFIAAIFLQDLKQKTIASSVHHPPLNWQ